MKVKNPFKSLIKKKLKSELVIPYESKENYITAHQDVNWWQEHINNVVLQQYSDKIIGTVADFGCNHGACTILAARNSKVEKIIGVDLNENSIVAANTLRDNSSENNDITIKVEFQSSSFEKMNFNDNYFDSAIMFHVIEHIYAKDRFLIFKEIKRVLKKDAYFLITLPYKRAYNDGFQHVAFFTTRTIKRTMKNLGFCVIECYRDRRPDAHTPNGHNCINLLCQNSK